MLQTIPLEITTLIKLYEDYDRIHGSARIDVRSRMEVQLLQYIEDHNEQTALIPQAAYIRDLAVYLISSSVILSRFDA